MIADVVGTAYTDMGLAPSTSYEYSVRAVDAEGNESAFSATAYRRPHWIHLRRRRRRPRHHDHAPAHR